VVEACLVSYLSFLTTNFCTVLPDVFFLLIGSSRYELDETAVNVLKRRSTSIKYERVAAAQWESYSDRYLNASILSTVKYMRIVSHVYLTLSKKWG
jgi:hypothetical protein